MRYFPIFVDLKDRKVVVVGGGAAQGAPAAQDQGPDPGGGAPAP